MEIIKRAKGERAKSFVAIGLLIAFIITGMVLWFVYYHGKTHSADAVAHIDGTITEGEDAVQKAMEGFSEAQLADMYESSPEKDTKRVALIFVGFAPEKETTLEVLDSLEEYEIHAAFALNAVEGYEDEELVDAVLDAGCEIYCAGVSDADNLQLEDDETLVSFLLKGRQQLSTFSDDAIDILYLKSTLYTSRVLKAASVSGFSAVISPLDEDVLSDSSFIDSSGADAFVSNINGDTIVIYDLSSSVADIENVSAVEPEQPAIDKQPSLEEEQEKEEEEEQHYATALITAIYEEGLDCVSLRDFDLTSGAQAIEESLSQDDARKAIIYHSCLTSKDEIGLAIAPLPDQDKLESVLAQLKKDDMGATFFVTQEEMEERGDSIGSILDAGFYLGYCSSAEVLSAGDATAAFEELEYGKNLLLESYDVDSSLYLLSGVEDLDVLRKAAYAAGMTLIDPENPEKLSKGAFVLLTSPDPDEVAALDVNATEAGLRVEDIQTALDDSGSMSSFDAQEISELRKKNDGARVEEISYVATTERAISYIFYSPKNDVVVDDVVSFLSKRSYGASFFFTFAELQNQDTIVEEILDLGYEIGITYDPSTDYPQEFSSVVAYIDSWQKYAAWRYGVSSNIIFIPASSPEDETLEAISAMECTLTGKTYRIVNTGDENLKRSDVQTVIEDMSGLLFIRGSIASFNMDYYVSDASAKSGSKTVLGAVLKAFTKEFVDPCAYTNPETGKVEKNSRFSVLSFSSLMDSDKCYTLPEEAEQDIITLDKDVLTNMADDTERFNYIKEHYVGTSYVFDVDTLPGFSKQERAQLDSSGRFTDKQVLFLSFDDWGTEESLNHLLYVLDKHNVKATFFIQTKNVAYNVNLLRTIAEEGHQIASHTDEHLGLANYIEDANVYTALTDEENESLRLDLVESYNILYRYTSDIEVEGIPALTTMFRPPTLAVSKQALNYVFDVGYTWSVSGDFSTHDYEAESLEDLLYIFKNGYDEYGRQGSFVGQVGSGSIIVMHMSETAVYTAQALDIMIPEWKEEGYDFARLDEYLK